LIQSVSRLVYFRNALKLKAFLKRLYILNNGRVFIC